MVNSVNGNRGSSVIPVTESNDDDYVFLGRGRHVLLDGTDVYMSGLSGISLADGITASGNSKMTSIRSTSASMKLLLLLQIDNTDDYTLKYGGYDIS